MRPISLSCFCETIYKLTENGTYIPSTIIPSIGEIACRLLGLLGPKSVDVVVVSFPGLEMTGIAVWPTFAMFTVLTRHWGFTHQTSGLL